MNIPVQNDSTIYKAQTDTTEITVEAGVIKYKLNFAPIINLEAKP